MSSAVSSPQQITKMPDSKSASALLLNPKTTEKNSIQAPSEQKLTPLQEGFKTTQDNIAKKLAEIKKKIEESEGSESDTGTDNKQLIDNLKKQQELLEKLTEENKEKALISEVKEHLNKEREEQQKLLEARKEQMMLQSLLDYQEYRKYLKLREIINQKRLKGLDLSIGIDDQKHQENQFTQDNQLRQHQALNLENSKEVIGRFTQMVSNERSNSSEIDKPKTVESSSKGIAVQKIMIQRLKSPTEELQRR